MTAAKVFTGDRSSVQRKGSKYIKKFVHPKCLQKVLQVDLNANRAMVRTHYLVKNKAVHDLGHQTV